MEEEIWKDIPGYESLYQASTLGRRKSLARLVEYVDGRKRYTNDIIKKTVTDYLGYQKLGLSKNNKEKKYGVHQLVALTFLNHNICGLEKVVDHIDNNPKNNNLNNLRIVTNRQNCQNRGDKTSSKFPGVHKNSADLWTAGIKIKGKGYNITSRCKTEEEAYKIYLKACENVDIFDGDMKKFRKEIGVVEKSCKPYFDKSKNKFVSEITINNISIFLKRFKEKDDAIKMNSIAKQNKHLFKGDKPDFRAKVKKLFESIQH